MAGAIAETTGGNAIHDIIDHGPMTFRQVLIIAVCFILNMLDGFDVTAMAYAANPITQEWAISAGQLGWLFSAALIGMTLGAMFIAPFSDVIGRRNMLILAVISIGITMIASGLTNSFWQLLPIRVLTGLGVGAVLVTNASMAAEYTPDKFRNLTVTAITAGYPFGAMAVGPFAAVILPEYGWRVLFVGGGVITICLSLLVVLLVPESIKFLALKRGEGVLEKINKTLVQIKREPLVELPEIAISEDEKSGNVSSLLAPDYKSTTLRLWSVFFMAFFTLYFMMSWIPRILIKSGLPEDFSGLALTLFNLGGVVGIVVLGLLTTRVKLYRVITPFLGFGATTMLLYAMFAGDSRAMILGLLGVGGFLMHAGFTGLYAVAARVYPTSIRSTGVGWGIGLGRVGAIIGPLIGGLLVGMDWTVTMLFVAFSIPMYFAMWNARKLPV